MEQVYRRAYTEILDIIKYIPLYEYQKIPKEKLEFYNSNKDPSYKFEYNPNKTLDEQNVLRETKALLVILFRDTVASLKQKEKLNKILVQNEQLYQEELKLNYNYDELFSKKQKTITIEDTEKQNIEKSTQLIVYKENIFSKLYNIFKKLFNKKKYN